MEGYSGKRGASGIITPKKGYIVGFKNASTNTDDQDARFCNRIGCSGRIKYSCSNTKIGSSEKAKFSNKTSFSSSNGNETIGNSSKGNVSLITRARNLFFDGKREIYSSQSGDSETRLGSKNKTEEVVVIAKNGSSSVLSNIRPRKAFHYKSEPNNQTNTQSPSNSKISSLRTLNKSSSSSSSSNSSSSSSRYGMRNLKRDLISESKSTCKNVTKKKNPEFESRLSRGGPQNGHLCSSSGGASSISDSGSSHFASADSKSVGSVRMRRLPVVNNGSNARNGLWISEPRVNVGGPHFPASDSSSGPNHGLTLRRYNMDGINEVLLAIERFERDEELTHEQALALETNLVLSGLNMYDQHRDMRLDIDNMSYEELLALEERMGTVSTALSEEALLKCFKKSIYDTGPSKVRDTESGEEGDDIKCSICQEEYALGDETGKLVECQHGYHSTCIKQWLRLKNWCPICKAAVAPQE